MLDRLSCDVVTFEEALARGAPAEALEAYGGDLLEGFHVSRAAACERWLDERRGGLPRSACGAAWELALEAKEDGDPAAAASWAQYTLRLAPDDEAVLRQVIGWHDRVGHRAGSVREYEASARRLMEDLDLEPTPETRALVDPIRSRGAYAAAPSVGRQSPDTVIGAAVAMRQQLGSTRNPTASVTRAMATRMGGCSSIPSTRICSTPATCQTKAETSCSRSSATTA